MSIEAVARTLPAPLGGSGKLVLIGLANHAHPDGREARPSVGRLASYAYCDPRTVQRNLLALKARGWIEPTGVHHDGTVIYRLRFDVWEAELKRLADAAEGDNSPPRQIAAPPATMPGGPPATMSPKPSFNRPSSVSSPRSREDELTETVEHVRGVLQRGIDGITGDEPCKPPGAGAIREALTRHAVDAQTARLVAVEVRAIVQAQNRAPNVTGLYAQRLAAAVVARSERESQRALTG